MARPSKLINDLNSVPAIVGNLGLSISEAQKAFNLDYLQAIERLVGLAKSVADATPPDTSKEADPEKRKALLEASAAQFEGFKGLLFDLLKATAPSRYQFSETTLAVRLDLAQSADLALTAGFGAGFGAVAINASVTVGFGYDYRAAAECRTVIHAIPADPASLNTLLTQADKANSRALELPPRHPMDQRIIDQMQKTLEKLTGRKAAAITEETKG
ncbi:MAG: hypothetical protein JNL10_14515 [Verrucomicrobiales bacterium]|nr:hypothetical protein [Verrucomicrobiales bacterium]